MMRGQEWDERSRGVEGRKNMLSGTRVIEGSRKGRGSRELNKKKKRKGRRGEINKKKKKEEKEEEKKKGIEEIRRKE